MIEIDFRNRFQIEAIKRCILVGDNRRRRKNDRFVTGYGIASAEQSSVRLRREEANRTGGRSEVKLSPERFGEKVERTKS